jgi:hypothetical protein
MIYIVSAPTDQAKLIFGLLIVVPANNVEIIDCWRGTDGEHKKARPDGLALNQT